MRTRAGTANRSPITPSPSPRPWACLRDCGNPSASPPSCTIVGKIGVPDHILTKAGVLTAEEFQTIRLHPALGAEILGTIGLFKAESALVKHHHERWDGQGYPDGLSGVEIPLGARVIAVADCIDAMLMERTYKKSYSVERMLDEITRCAGTQFDSKIAVAARAWCQSHREALFLPGKTAPTGQLVAQEAA